MKTRFVVTIATTFLVVVSPARAGDAPTGFGGAYLGLNAGAAWGTADYATDPGCPPNPATPAVFCNAFPSPSSVNGTAVATSGTGDLSPTSFIGGIQGGYNWQIDRIVVGSEIDFSLFDLDGSSTANGSFPFAFAATKYTLTESMSAQWMSTLRARAGYLVASDLMLYATGGVALTGLSFRSTYSDNGNNGIVPGGSGAGSKSEVRVGWALGGGGEWLLDNRWSVRAEYLYVDFGSMSVPVPTSNSPAFTQTMRVEGDLSASIARVGLNYNFGTAAP
jgi:outer membrane immunogenic protein